MFESRSAARSAISLLTEHELSPSTRDLLTLDGIAEAGGWAEEDERLQLVDVILSEYEAQAVAANDYDAVQPILVLRGSIDDVREGH